MKKRRYNVTAQVVCTYRKGRQKDQPLESRWRSSIGLTTVETTATTPVGALRNAKRAWRERGELPVPGTYRRASCRLVPDVGEL